MLPDSTVELMCPYILMPDGLGMSILSIKVSISYLSALWKGKIHVVIMLWAITVIGGFHSWLRCGQ